MTCNACGEKPKKTDREFTGPVIEINNPEQIVLLRKVVIPTSMGTEEQVPAAVGKYRNVILKYEANNHVYIYSSDGIPTLLEMDVPQEIWDSIEELQEEIDDIKNNPDVVDIVDTYADLQAYDTSDLGDKDVIRVLNDETHDGESSYYRWSTATQTWTFIGATGPYYTKDEVDDLIDEGIESIDSSARVLSVDDYNWPEDNPDGVALWKLPYGAYRTPSDGGVKYYIARDDSGSSYRFFMIYPDISSSPVGATILSAASITGDLYYKKGKITSVAAAGSKMSEGYIITSDAIIDNLNASGLGDQAALSAKQGYVLNTRIGDLSSLQTVGKSSTVAAINEVNSSIGKAKVLSSADYNWNSTAESATEPYDSVALHLLSPGLYIVPANITGFIGYSTDMHSWFQTNEDYLYMVTQRGPYGHMIICWMADLSTGGSPFQMARVYRVSASLGRPNIVARAWIGAPIDDLDSSSTSFPLSANQGQRIKNMIGNLNSLATQDKQSLVTALNQFISRGGYDLTYSRDTLTVWVDDEPIQKITKKVASLPNNSSQIFSLGLSNVKDVVKIEIVAHDQVNNIFKPIPDGAGASAELTSAGMKITTTADYSGYSAYITVYYTEQTS